MATGAQLKIQASRYRYFRANLLSVERIRTLGKIQTPRVLRDLVTCWALIFAALLTVKLHPAFWTVALAAIVVGNRYYALFIIAHDGMHRRVASTTWMNDLICDVFVLGTIGAITRLNNHNHLEHHYWLGTERDPDRAKHCCFNKSSGIELLGFLSGVTIVFKAAMNVFRPRKPEGSASGYRARDLVIIFGWLVVLAGGLTWQIGWWAYPVLWLGPVYAFMYLADNFRSWAEHSHPETDDAADSHRLITYSSNWWERTLVAPMNMNYHTVHHLWPSIPYYNLPVADREIREMAAARGLEWRGSYFGYLRKYVSSLPLECPRLTE